MAHSRKRWTFGMVAALAGILSGSIPEQAASEWQLGTPMVTYWNGPGQKGWGPLNEASARQMVEGGFNVVFANTYEEVQMAQSHGLRTMFHSDLLARASLGDPAKLTQLNALIDQLRASPAHYGYFLSDEPGAMYFSDLGCLVAHLNSRDPDHLAYINLLPNYASNEQLGTAGDPVTAYRAYLSRFARDMKPSLFAYDHYHFTTSGDSSGYFQNLAMVAAASRQAGIPLMNTVQAYSYAPSVRVPNVGETRFLAYTTLAYGGQGISWFQYTSTDPKVGGIVLSDGKPMPIYTTLKTLNREFVAIAKQFQPLKWLGAYHFGMQPPGTTQLPSNASFQIRPAVPNVSYVDNQPVQGIVLGLFGPADKPDGTTNATCALVVNLDYTNSKTTTLVGPGDLSLFDAMTGKWTATGSHQATLNLSAGSGIMVAVTSALPVP